MSKTVIPFTVQHVKFETPLAFAEVVSRLEIEVNKAGSGEIMPRLIATKDKLEVQSILEEVIGKNIFLYFEEHPFHKLLEQFSGTPQPSLVTYSIGNPLLAEEILRYNRAAGYDIPLRLLVAEKPNGGGTVVSYHLPSTVLGTREGADDPVLRTKLESLDGKLENLVLKITSKA